MKMTEADIDWQHAHGVASAELSKARDEIERLRAALYEVTTNGEWTEGEQRGEWKISKEVYETARDACEQGACSLCGLSPEPKTPMRGHAVSRR